MNMIARLGDGVTLDGANAALATIGARLAEEYPQYAGKRVCFELECVGAPGSRELGLLTAMRNFAEGENLGFRVNALATRA